MPISFVDRNLICPSCGNKITISEVQGGYFPIWVKILSFRSLSNKRKITCSNCKGTIVFDIKKNVVTFKGNK